MLNFVKKIKNNTELEDIMSLHKLVRILTNGEDVFAWDGELANHYEVSLSSEELANYENKGYANYMIENGFLYHSICKYPEIAHKFIKNWFPNSHCAKYGLIYNDLGINLKA